MNFGIKRQVNEPDGKRQYHLYDGAGNLILVADQSSPWQAEKRNQARFARPDGQPVAVLDWPQSSAARRRQGLVEQSYAIVLNDAVFAILVTVCGPQEEKEGDAAKAGANRLIYLTVDVADTKFLVLPPAGGGPGADIYAGIPAGLSFFRKIERDKLPDPLGFINTAISYTYIAEVPAESIPREGLILLAVAYLLDGACQPAPTP